MQRKQEESFFLNYNRKLPLAVTMKLSSRSRTAFLWGTEHSSLKWFPDSFCTVKNALKV